MERALATGATLIGVNNRDLRTLSVDLAVTERLARQAPPRVVLVSESGITDAADARRMALAGARALLVGETLVRAGAEDLPGTYPRPAQRFRRAGGRPMTRVKVCGLTRERDVRRAVELGAAACGFVLSPSPRRVTPERAGELAAQAADSLCVGVVTDGAGGVDRRRDRACRHSTPFSFPPERTGPPSRPCGRPPRDAACGRS